MYACVYFEKDATLSVVHEKDKDLTINTTFEERQFVQMRWKVAQGKTKESFSGIIVKVGENEGTLTKFATKAYNGVLKGVPPGTPAPEQLFAFNEAKRKTNSKRERVPTQLIKESRLQEEQLSTPKKKKQKSDGASTVPDTVPDTQKSQNVIQTTVSTLFSQFQKSVSASLSGKAAVGKVPLQAPNMRVSDSKSKAGEPDPEAGVHDPEAGVHDPEAGEPDPEAGVHDPKAGVHDPEAGVHDHKAPSRKTQMDNLRAPSMQTPIDDPKAPSLQTLNVSYSQSQTRLSDTWRACHGALDVLGSTHTEDIPARVSVTPAIISTLRGLASPEFTDFVQRLAEHMESDNCAHTCLKHITDQHVQSHDGLDIQHSDDGGFLSQLEDQDSSFHIPATTNFSHQQPGVLFNLPCTETANDERTITLLEVENLPSSNDRDDAKETLRRTSPRKQAKSTLSSLTTPTKDDQETLRRTSPRKHPATTTSIAQSPTTPTSGDQIRLLQTSDLYVSRHELRKICQHASRKRHKAAEVLMYGLLGEVFTLEEMAESRGLGLSKPKPEDANRPVLDETKIAVLKEYVHSWCKKNVGQTFPAKDLNRAVTERNSYARKQIKKRH